MAGWVEEYGQSSAGEPVTMEGEKGGENRGKIIQFAGVNDHEPITNYYY